MIDRGQRKMMIRSSTKGNVEQEGISEKRLPSSEGLSWRFGVSGCVLLARIAWGERK